MLRASALALRRVLLDAKTTGRMPKVAPKRVYKSTKRRKVKIRSVFWAERILKQINFEIVQSQSVEDARSGI